MTRPKTLNELDHLRLSRFGRPRPRHGLRLLYWFATECVSFQNGALIPECNPESRDFGFHLFENRYDQGGVKLLPDVDFEYYVVGNLNRPGAQDLPSYVGQDYSGSSDNSNMDRIIVSLDEDLFDRAVFDRVYVTEHSDRSNYNPDATYHISKGLLKHIGSLELENFLGRTGYSVPTIHVPVPPADCPIRINPELPSVPSAGSSSNQDVTVQIEPPVPDVTPVSIPSAGSSSNQDVTVEIEPPPIPDVTPVSIEDDTQLVRFPKPNRYCNCTIL